MSWKICGDRHGSFDVFRNEEYSENDNIIILGDAGFNFYLNKTDRNLKSRVNELGPTFYCVRGNHEARPQDVPMMEKGYDSEVQGIVYYEAAFPHIKYFEDGGEYNIDGHTVLVLGGAYSVDKFYRLDHNYPWFENEQLTEEERNEILTRISGKTYDFIFSHTCPYEYRPTDLFLPNINQSTVDNTMELWLSEINKIVNWGVWCWGHYHEDRLERERCEMFYRDIVELASVWNRWFEERTIENEWWLKKSPNYYMR